jgi:hypothetical protein
VNLKLLEIGEEFLSDAIFAIIKHGTGTKIQITRSAMIAPGCTKLMNFLTMGKKSDQISEKNEIDA